MLRLMPITNFKYNNNPVDNISPSVQRWLHRLNKTQFIHNIFNDTQNVHDSHIQRTINDSIHKIMYVPELAMCQVIDEIMNDSDINCKELLIEYINDAAIHSVLNLTFGELFNIVYCLMRKHSQFDEIKKVLNVEMNDSMCKCFTGRMSRLINVLNGYDERIQINISKNQAIGNIIIISKNNNITIWKENFIKMMIENDYKNEIDKWIEYIQ